ncbi:AAA family ATPase [Kitasatospora sp. NPDC058218]|uniref:helix-turn-helix transcriptional regulator n=1 Tax=Kitasatospora sp. NPDC058218 TaxID=3346385 RepID=UPI0036DDE554
MDLPPALPRSGATAPGAPPADPEPIHRETERRTLTALLAGLRSGRPAVVTVAGPPGFGQNGLVRWAAHRAERDGLRVLHVRAARFEREVRHGALARLLAPLDGAAGRTGHTGGRRAGPGAPPGPPEPGESPEPRELPGPAELAATARRWPTLLAVEDAHWLDAASLHWLSALVRRSVELPVAVLASGSGVTAEGPDWLSLPAGAPDQVVVCELTPAPLDAAAAAAEVARFCGRAGDRHFTAVLHEIAAGHPALLRESLRQFAALGHQPVAARAPELRTIGGGVLGDHVARVLSGLGAEVAAVVRALAVCGELLDFDAVCRLARVSAPGEDRLRAALAATGFVRPSSGRPYLEPAVRARVLEEMTVGDRADLHTGAAELAHRAAADDQDVAALLLGARATGAPWAAAVLRRGGLTALRHGEPDRATGLLARALEQEGDPRTRGRLDLELAVAELLSTPEAGDRRLGGIVRSAASPAALRVRAADLGLGWGDADAMRRAVAEVLPATRGLERDDLIALFWSADATPPDGSASFPPEVPALPDPPASPAQAGVRAWHLALAGDGPERVRELARAALAGREAVGGGLFQPRLAACKALMLADDHDEAEAGLTSLLSELTDDHLLVGLAPVLAARAELRLRRGRPAAAERDLGAAERALRPVGRYAVTLAHLRAVRIVVELESGRPDTAGALAAAPLPDAAQAGEHWPGLLFARALVASAGARPQEARELLLEAGRRLLNRHRVNPALLPWRSLAARACRALGDEQEARRLNRAELLLARRWGTPSALAWAELCVELCAGSTEGSDRPAALRRIVRTAGSGPAGPGGPAHTRALAEQCAAELAQGGRRAAAAALAELSTFEDATRPAGPVATRARHLAQELARSARSCGGAHALWDALTPAERRTARLVGRGHTNRSAAGVLAVSTRTVELRLSRTYLKLGITGRQELCSFLRAMEGR